MQALWSVENSFGISIDNGIGWQWVVVENSSIETVCKSNCCTAEIGCKTDVVMKKFQRSNRIGTLFFIFFGPLSTHSSHQHVDTHTSIIEVSYTTLRCQQFSNLDICPVFVAECCTSERDNGPLSFETDLGTVCECIPYSLPWLCVEFRTNYICVARGRVWSNEQSAFGVRITVLPIEELELATIECDWSANKFVA